jgi:hypothetical protein
MEAEQVPKTVSSLTKHQTIENIQYICQFVLEILDNLEETSPHKCFTYG